MRIKFILSNILILAIGQICFSSVIDQSKNLENRNFEAISFLGENDIGFSDRYYTNGLKLTYTASGDDFLTSKLQFSLLELITDAHSQRYQTVSLGQAMYVASTITHSNPPLDDHPYAGWLYANFGAHIVTKTSLDSIAFAIGVVGDWSFAEEVQKFHHSNIDVDKPMGWRQYAARVENDRGKTEMWYIVDADPDAEIICGLADGVSREDFAVAVANGSMESALKRQPVRAGETYFIPAGLTHAIGKGILIAEIQQNCDRTYRVYDYERRQPDGSLRELHVEKALDVIRPFTEDEINAIRYSRTGGVAESDAVLAHCDFFRVEKRDLTLSPITLREGIMQHLLCLNGEATVECDGECYTLARGESWLIPAALKGVTLTGDATLLISSVK